jgi:hypothetical protein
MAGLLTQIGKKAYLITRGKKVKLAEKKTILAC